MARTRPNILFVMTDDHASHAISAYGSRINTTPHLDRLADEGMRFDNCFCTNAICTPSRATILTGMHSHACGVTTLDTHFDNRLPTFAGLLRESGYQTALFGKWHLGEGTAHEPRGFDEWEVVPGQGDYHDPEFITPNGRHVRQGYATDIITDLSLDWLQRRDVDRPFCLLVHHKAPHRPWEPDEKHAHMYDDVDIPEPETLRDDYSDRSEAAAVAAMRVAEHLTPTDLKEPVPDGLSPDEELSWKYQRYIKDYLRCVASVDDNVGRLLDYLDEQGLAEDTLVVYCSDQGFFLGDHGWYDKRFMYEESLRMPLLVRYPREVTAGSVNTDIVLNLDFAQTFCDVAGVAELPIMQGRSMMPLLRGEGAADWRTSMYYRYWMHGDSIHHARAHYGVRTEKYKLICYYGDGRDQPGSSDRRFEPEWELFDLERDPMELTSVYDDPDYAAVRKELEIELERVQREAGDLP
ncbi:sulfatase family protein [Phytoactinopolyspora halotolerans]|uniref:Sulfatase n=1 Tax=Phytoactinopolyspora halotolerans TaxID=1981512 RepID=A0A6L9S4U1_9ACTN|nr:sulfatase [Phytoactinopolyspora halotolerans]NEE00156.1 sulfatase [Phytoactinopolyspora halotolerans]